MQRKQTTRSFVYLTIGLALLFYALPRVPHVTGSLEGAFTCVWLGFAMLIISSNLYYLIGVDKERQDWKMKRHAWLQRGMRDLQRGYFNEAKREIRQKKQRRFMS
ncbi:hypothetical protein CIG75_05505 [Tumebacillus algifaecis]|uniref:Uncharacterized protein n=1 Tax=Tumebacillus algifaecis TaxID=1214604 RepID=A0A223CZ99_9BACL|nr:hypothetical protein [Tumebacillus algifaecis]ASS74504.1 hypothetical protein CIG75_05505 [Tumebacillus algifaecis]